MKKSKGKKDEKKKLSEVKTFTNVHDFYEWLHKVKFKDDKENVVEIHGKNRGKRGNRNKDRG